MLVTRVGMHPESLKRNFGGKVMFWGGEADTQQVLCKARPEEVKRVLAMSLRDLKAGGAYVFTQFHNIQPHAPDRKFSCCVRGN